jgi:hypothetical protein
VRWYVVAHGILQRRDCALLQTVASRVQQIVLDIICGEERGFASRSWKGVLRRKMDHVRLQITLARLQAT